MAEKKINSEFGVRIAAGTHVGIHREHNEDAFIICPNLSNKEWESDTAVNYSITKDSALAVVADGMGGVNAGEVASKIAIQSVQNYFIQNYNEDKVPDLKVLDFSEKAIHYANREIQVHVKSNPETKGMGTTIVLAHIRKNFAYITWVGDSRAYLFRPSEGLLPLSEDHSLVQELVNRGEISKEQAFFHPDGNIITQSLGDGQKNLNVGKLRMELFKGDQIILCSDGLNGMLQDSAIEETILAEQDVPEKCVETLINKANTAGGMDNITVAIIKQVSGNNPSQNRNTLSEFNTIKPSTNVSKKRKKKNLIGIIVLFLIPAIVFVLMGADLFKPKEVQEKTETEMKEDSNEVVNTTSGLDSEIQEPTDEIIIEEPKETKENSDEKIEELPEQSLSEELESNDNTTGDNQNPEPIDILEIPLKKPKPQKRISPIDQFLSGLGQFQVSGNDQKKLIALETNLKKWRGANSGMDKEFYLIQAIILVEEKTLLNFSETKLLDSLKIELKIIAQEQGLKIINQYDINTSESNNIIDLNVYLITKENNEKYFHFIFDKGKYPEFNQMEIYYGVMNSTNQLKFISSFSYLNSNDVFIWQSNNNFNTNEDITLSIKGKKDDNSKPIKLQFKSSISTE